MSWYLTPGLRHMGDGTLACVKYVGGKPQSRRRPYYTVADIVPGDVKSDVNLLSYYLKNRQAAENASKLFVTRSNNLKLLDVRDTFVINKLSIKLHRLYRL